jgi:hypothetical protein
MKNLDPNDPKRLDGLTPQQLLEEIGQIAAQYLKGSVGVCPPVFLPGPGALLYLLKSVD